MQSGNEGDPLGMARVTLLGTVSRIENVPSEVRDGYLQRLWLGINASRLANLTSARYVFFGPLKDQSSGQWKPTP